MRIKNKRYKFSFFIPSAALLMGFFFLANGPATKASAGPSFGGDYFVTSSISEPQNLIPLLATDSSSAEISRLIFNGLVKYDKDLKLVGDLAESWEVLDEGKRIIFHLRKNVRWQDGVAFTADDVDFTFKKLTDASTPTPYGGDFEKISALRTPDAYTVEVVYREPFSPGLSSWVMGMLPKHLLEHQDIRHTPFSRSPIGTGPYKFKQWKSAEKLELIANDDYFEGRPSIDRVITRVIPDQVTTFLELQTENVDAAALTPLQYQKQTGTEFFKEHYRKFRYTSFGYTYLGYNLENELFKDRRVRNAIGLAIDKQKIIDVTLLGLGRITTGPFLPASWAYDPNVKAGAFDPERAKTLLREAGWVDTDGDGLIDKNGRKFQFTLLTNQGNDQRRMASEMIQKDLRAIGIDMKIQVVEWGTFLREFVDKHRFDAVLLAWNLGQDPDIYDIFYSSKTKPSEFNFVSYNNPEVDRLLDEARRVFGENARAPLYHRVHAILHDEEPYTFLYAPEALPIIHERFKGVQLAPAGLMHNFIHWSVPAGQRRYPERS